MPSEFEDHSFMRTAAFPGENGQPVTVMILGGDGLSPERMTSYEIGYRGVLSPSVSLDVTAYRNLFHNLVNNEMGTLIVQDGQPVLPLYFHNAMQGEAKGIEALLTFRPSARWDVVAGYTVFGLRLDDYGDGVSDDDLQLADVPRHQVSLRSFFTVSPRLEIDGAAYYAGGIASQGVQRYLRTDLRAGWQLPSGFELSLAGKNLTNRGRIEYNGISEQPAITPVSRTFTATLAWRH
jgi:outer membrane receptor protein involved in Fe transport